MSRFAKVGTMLGQLSADGLPEKTRPFNPKGPALVLVQVRDEDHFWCNVHELPDVPSAIKFAAAHTRETKNPTRVVVGPKRQVVRELYP